MKLRIQKLRPDAWLPAYAHGPDEDAGLDLRAVEEVLLEPGVPAAVPTGLAIELPPGVEGQVRPRSGLALRHAVTVANSPGTIDPGYRGELNVILVNLGRASYRVCQGDRIAQLVIARYEPVAWEEGELSPTQRGDGGLGSTGR